MAAPDTNKCEKCLMPMPVGARVCPECGAPVGDVSTTESEAVVYPELARANLARMRGDYKQAEDVLLSVLKRFPNNPSANEMLGDLAAERDDYGHAIQWYELALEIVPDSASIGRKLRDARAHVERQEARDTTAQLGLPDPSSRMPVLIGAAVIVVLGLSAGAYYLGAKGQTAKGPPTLKLEASAERSQANNPASEQKNNPAVASGVEEEQQLTQTLVAKSKNSNAIVSVIHDPRSSVLIVTFNMPEKDPRMLAGQLAVEAFDALPGYNSVTVRGVSQGKIVYMADASRAKVTETQTPDYKQQHQNAPGAWLDEVLTNEWPPPASTNPSSSSGTSTGSEPPGTSSTGATASTGGAPPTTTTTNGGG